MLEELEARLTSLDSFEGLLEANGSCGGTKGSVN